MHSSQYQTEVLRTANIEIRSELEILSELGLGITGEAGEVADISYSSLIVLGMV